MLKRIVVLMAVVVALVALLVPSSTHASMSTLAMSKVNHLTFNTAVRLPRRSRRCARCPALC